jgi:O-antigen/teichoic acid export membrane protein
MKHFGRLSIAQVSKSVIVNGFQLGMAAIGQAHAGGLIGSTVLGAVTVSSVLARQIWRDDKRIFMQNIRLSHIFQGMRRYRKFPLFNTWSALINTGSRQLPAFFLTFFFSPTVVGYYAVGNRVLHLPISLIGSAIGQVFFQRASATYQGEESLSGLVLSLFRRLVAFGLFPTLLLMVVGEDLFTLVFGSQWSEAGVYAQILSPWMFFVFISSPMSTLFSILERQEAALLRDIVILVSRAATLGIGGVLGDERLTLFLFSGSGVLVYGALSFWILKMSNVSRSSIFYVLLRYLGVSILIISPLVAIKFLTSADSLALLAGAVITGGIYGLFLIRQESELIQQLRQFLA